jgi:hypothetical protein
MNHHKHNVPSLAVIAVAAIAALWLSSVTATSARADAVNVEINGSVEWNQITPPPLGNVRVGDVAKLTFALDTANYVNNPVYPTRGYVIDPSSFKLVLGTTEIGLQNPFPVGKTPYFVIRNNDPAVDGFFISTGLSFFDGVPLNQAGAYTQFNNEFHVTYGGATLSSLDLAGALGHYDFAGLTVFNWTIDDGPFNALGVLFTDMTISAVPEPATASAAMLAIGAIAAGRRRR